MFNPTKKFFDLYSEGSALEEEIDDFISAWHLEINGKQSTTFGDLPVYLGMSQDEFDVWVQEPDALPHLLNARLQNRNLAEVMREHIDEMLIAARASDSSSIVALKAWLERRNAGSV